MPLIERAKERHNRFGLGVNFLGVTGREAFPIHGDLADRGIEVDAYWADDARIDEAAPVKLQAEAGEINRIRSACNWRGLYFGGTAFKKQRLQSADGLSPALIENPG